MTMTENSLTTTLIIETIPLPLAGVLFSDSVHEKILNRYNMDAGVVMFEKSHDEYYLDSVIGIPSYNSKEEHLFSEICAEVNLNLESLNGSTNPLQSRLPDIPALNQFLESGGFKGVRIFKIYDYIHTSGFWMMFYRLDGSPELPRLPGLFSPDSLYMVDEIKKNLDQQSRQISIDEIVPRWTRLLDIRDKETKEHTHRVANLAVELGEKCGLSPQELEHLRLGAFLHDIGKVVIPNDILHKAGSLTEAEWEIMKLHPRIAKELLSNLSLPQAVLDIPLYHHERWSGGGYPYGLVGEQIPLPVRIFSVVDVWDALNTNRPYRKKWVEAKAREYIADKMWTEFDPEVTRIFLEI